MRRLVNLATSLSLAAAAASFAWPNRTGAGVRNLRKRAGFDPAINRWTGEPHEHRREIERRTRQSAARKIAP